MPWSHTLHELAAAIGAEPPQADVSFSGVSTDTRTIQRGSVFFALNGERFDGNVFVAEAFAKGACAAVASRLSEAGPCLVSPEPLKALQAFAAWRRMQYHAPLIAITGSCGKTSTKDYTAAVLASKYRVVKTQGNLNNDIGCPLSLLRLDQDTERAVIEMGANHIGEIASLCALARPTEAAITLIAPSHLEGFGSIENIAKAKSEIIDALPSDGVFYVNVDNPWCVRIAESFHGEKISFGSHGDVVVESCALEPLGEMCVRIAPVGEMRLPLSCPAHAWNVALAVAIGLRHGVEQFEEPLRAACLSTTRFKVLKYNGAEIIDDTYNANPASMAASLEALAARPVRKRIAALGDMLELGAYAGELHRELGALTGKLGIDCVFARGEYAHEITAGARGAGVSHAEVLQEPSSMAAAIQEMLSPGSALLVKGSRGMKMERVIEELQTTEEAGN